jgi:DnaJ domain
MPRDPVNDVFNELIDIAIDTMLDTMQPEFKRMARQLVTDAQRRSQQSAPKAERTGFKKGRTKQSDQSQHQSHPVRRPQVTLYDTLEVSTKASIETIEAAYKSLARRHHPDVGGALAKMQEITNAYSVLKDKEARKKYDRSVGL